MQTGHFGTIRFLVSLCIFDKYSLEFCVLQKPAHSLQWFFHWRIRFWSKMYDNWKVTLLPVFWENLKPKTGQDEVWIICYSDIVKRPSEEQEYCYNCRFVVKLCIVPWRRKTSLTPTSWLTPSQILNPEKYTGNITKTYAGFFVTAHSRSVEK